MRKIPNTPIVYSRVLPSWKNILSKHAIYRHSYGNMLSSMLRRYVMRKMKTQSYNHPLYRGLKRNKNIKNFSKKNVVKRNWFSSFSKNLTVANSYTRNNNPKILVMNNPKMIKSLNYKNYKSEYPGEAEVLVAPGTFHVKRRNGKFIYVNYYNE